MGRAGAPSHHRVVHAAPYDTTDYFGKALCGKAPSTRWHGWQWPHPLHPASYWQIECPRCIKAVANLKPANVRANRETP